MVERRVTADGGDEFHVTSRHGNPRNHPFLCCAPPSEGAHPPGRRRMTVDWYERRRYPRVGALNTRPRFASGPLRAEETALTPTATAAPAGGRNHPFGRMSDVASLRYWSDPEAQVPASRRALRRVPAPARGGDGHRSPCRQPAFPERRRRAPRARAPLHGP